ncbi:hypothetical protein [Terasakiispira papahanaumokuakeensis]|nr:hypothetical protein [Terasakiispira papahanaumokuakeensis]
MSLTRTLIMAMMGLIFFSVVGCAGPGAKSFDLSDHSRDALLRNGISRQLSDLPDPVAQQATLYMQGNQADQLPAGCRLKSLSALVKQGVLGSERFPFVLPLSHQNQSPNEPFGTMRWTVSQTSSNQCQWQGTLQYQEHTWTLTVDYAWRPQASILAKTPAAQASVTGSELAADTSPNTPSTLNAY